MLKNLPIIQCCTGPNLYLLCSTNAPIVLKHLRSIEQVGRFFLAPLCGDVFTLTFCFCINLNCEGAQTLPGMVVGEEAITLALFPGPLEKSEKKARYLAALNFLTFWELWIIPVLCYLRVPWRQEHIFCCIFNYTLLTMTFVCKAWILPCCMPSCGFEWSVIRVIYGFSKLYFIMKL